MPSGGFFASRVVSAPMPEPVEAADEPTTIGTSSWRDTLTKADKLAATYTLHSADAPLAITSNAALLEPIKPKTLIAKEPILLPRPRPKNKLAKNGYGVGSKAASEIKTCREQDVIAKFLASGLISTRCAT